MIGETQLLAEDSPRENNTQSLKTSQRSFNERVGIIANPYLPTYKKGQPKNDDDGAQNNDGRKSVRRLRGQRGSQPSTLYVTPVSNKNGDDEYNAYDHDENIQTFE